MKIIKRSGAEADFDPRKIVTAVTKANESVVPSARMSAVQIRRIAEDVESAAQNINRSLSVEEIQDMVEDQIMNQRAFDVARRYITYRYRRALVRKSNTTDEQILSLIECNNEEVKQENSNKNPTVNSVQRDYMAGEVSKDITRRLLLPPDIVNAHEQGVIHFHDADYFAQHMHNCDLVNLEDMLQNGTVISGTLTLDRVLQLLHRLQHRHPDHRPGGLLPVRRPEHFPDPSGPLCGREPPENPPPSGRGAPLHPGGGDRGRDFRHHRKAPPGGGQKRRPDDPVPGGDSDDHQRQAPFVTVFMYLNEAKNEQEKQDLALIIEETLRQRYQGVKNEKGVWITRLSRSSSMCWRRTISTRTAVSTT